MDHYNRQTGLSRSLRLHFSFFSNFTWHERFSMTCFNTSLPAPLPPPLQTVPRPPDAMKLPSCAILNSSFKYHSHLWMSTLMKEASSLHPLPWQVNLQREDSLLNDYEHESTAREFKLNLPLLIPSLNGELQLKLRPQSFTLNNLLGVTRRYQFMFPSTQVEMQPRKTFLILSLSLFNILLEDSPTCMKYNQIPSGQKNRQTLLRIQHRHNNARLVTCTGLHTHTHMKTWGQMSLIAQTSHENRSLTL